MLEQLFDLIKGHASEEIINNPSIPNEHNNQAVGSVTESIFSGLQGALAGGGLQSVMNLFSGKDQVGLQNPLVGGIANNVVNSLMSKFGIDNPVAQSIAASLVPRVLSNLVSKTKDPNDSGFDMNGIIGSLIGGGRPQQSQGGVQLPGAQSGVNFNNILSNLMQGGVDRDHDGKIEMTDIIGMVTNATQQQPQQQQSGGGIFDMLKGMMGS